MGTRPFKQMNNIKLMNIRGGQRDTSIGVIPFTVKRERGTWFPLLQNATVKILLTVKRDVLRYF
jgi:hypothetical protein